MTLCRLNLFLFLDLFLPLRVQIVEVSLTEKLSTNLILDVTRQFERVNESVLLLVKLAQDMSISAPQLLAGKRGNSRAFADAEHQVRNCHFVHDDMPHEVSREESEVRASPVWEVEYVHGQVTKEVGPAVGEVVVAQKPSGVLLGRLLPFLTNERKKINRQRNIRTQIEVFTRGWGWSGESFPEVKVKGTQKSRSHLLFPCSTSNS